MIYLYVAFSVDTKTIHYGNIFIEVFIFTVGRGMSLMTKLYK